MHETVDLGVEGLSPAIHLGAGGSANVFAARLLETGEQVAVKLLRASADSEKERERFKRERETLDHLASHDGIVHVIDAGVTDRLEPYFLMPLMAGSLQDRIDNDGAMDWETAAQLVAEVADTVEFAHSQKILHRDLKPGNILLDDDGVPRVADFGIAKLMDSSVSKSSKALGTPSFMPPERFRAAEATEATDVYGLGATLAALLTGTAPFITGANDTDAAVMMRVISEDPPALIEHGIPERVAGVVTSSMAKDPAERPASASEFAQLLRTATTESGGAPTSGPLTVAIPRRDLQIPELITSATVADGEGEQRPAWLIPAAAALFLAVLGLGSAFALSLRDDTPSEFAGSVLEVTDELPAESEVVNSDGEGDATADTDGISDDAASQVGVEVAGATEANDKTITNDNTTTNDDDAAVNNEEPAIVTVAPATRNDTNGGVAASDKAQPARTETTAPQTVRTEPPVVQGKEQTEKPVVTPTTKPTTTTSKANVAPTACFSATTYTVQVHAAITFSNCSSDATSYLWEFGDGTTSSLASPSKTWSTAGSKTVKLTATGPGGEKSTTRTVTVTAAPVAAPHASFTVSASTIHEGDTVTFTSNSTGDITSTRFEFGDGTSANGSPAWHTYNHDGTYTAKLTVTGPGGSHSATKTITVNPTTVTPEFIQRIDIGDIGEYNLRFRFKTNVTTGYTIRIRKGTTVAATQNGIAQANVLVSPNVTGLTPGTDYTVQVTLNGPPAVSSSSVAFRTPGGAAPAPTPTAVAVQNLRLAKTQATRFEVNYESNVCANGSFVIREQGGPVVGSNAGQPDGCTTRHLGIPGFWTPALKPNTTYVITVTVEANGRGQGGGNNASQSLTVTTSG